MSDSALTLGVHHVGFTVPQITATRDFFVETLGFKVVGEKPAYPAVFVSDGVTMLTLWQAEDPQTARAFDRKACVGLHHVALKVGRHADLDALHARLQSAPDVQIEFAPEALGGAGWRHMMCHIPGGLRVEFTCTEAQA